MVLEKNYNILCTRLQPELLMFCWCMKNSPVIFSSKFFFFSEKIFVLKI